MLFFCLTHQATLKNGLKASRKELQNIGFCLIFIIYILSHLKGDPSPLLIIDILLLILLIEAGVCFDVSHVLLSVQSCIDRWTDRRAIKGIPRGAVNTGSPHTGGMCSNTSLAYFHYLFTSPLPPVWFMLPTSVK